MKAFVISTRTRVLHSDLVAHRLTWDIKHDFRVPFFLEVRSLPDLLFLKGLDYLDLFHRVSASMAAQASILEEP